MARIKITCDTACDLPRDLSRRYRIDLLPLGVRLGSEHRHDRLDVNSRELYAYTEKTGRLPGISPISPRDFRDSFQAYLSQGYQIVHISLSSQLSLCYRNACIAAEDLDGVYVVDSQSISTGAGQLAMLGAELASADYEAKEIAQALNDMKKHMDVSFVLQSPRYLHRKGKRGGFSDYLTRLFHLRPEIEVSQGAVHLGKPFRGNMEDTILSYVKTRLSGRHNIQTDRIFITYSGVPQTIVDKAAELLQQIQPFDQVLTVPASSAVSCRCGPGSLGLAFMTI